MADARHFADLSAKDGSGLATEGRAASSGGAHLLYRTYSTQVPWVYSG
jgi:hypothetical protein